MAGRTVLKHIGYGIVKDSLEQGELAELKKTLTVKPYSSMDMQNIPSFPIFQESATRIYVPKMYGIKRFGVPDQDTLEEGDKIDVPFNGELRPEQIRPVDAFLEAARDPTRCGGIINLSCAAGKCLAPGTEVVMYNGDTKFVEDVVPGDVFMGDDSTPRRVLSTCTGEDKMYRIRQSHGISYVVNASHILTLKNRMDGHVVDVPVELLPSYGSFELYGFKASVEWKSTIEIGIDPYIAGFWIGQGGGDIDMRRVHDQKIISYFARVSAIKRYDAMLEYCSGRNSYILPGMHECYKKFFLLSKRSRLSVVAGFVDASSIAAYESPHDGSCCFLTRLPSSEALVHVIRRTMHSLGINTDHMNSVMHIYVQDRHTIPTLGDIMFEKMLFRRPPLPGCSSITVEAMGKGTYYGFVLDGNGRFLLNDFTVTHNTVMALNIVSQIGRKAMIVVHKEFLLDQWRERIAQFLPTARVGIVKAAVCDTVDKDIVLGSLQSLSMKEYNTEVFRGISVSIFDECHHTGAQVFSRVFRKMTTKYTLGLSATLNRKDGLTKVFKWYIGEVVFKSNSQRNVDSMQVTVVKYYDADPSYSRDVRMFNGNPNISRMVTNICSFKPRTKLVVSILGSLLHDNPLRKVLIMSDRRSHLEELQEEIHMNLNGLECGLCYGGLPAAQIQESGRRQVLLGTYAYVSEGFDLPGLNTMILASPKSDVVQSVGRILRDKPECRMCHPLVIDIIDDFSIFPVQAKKREKYYASKGYDIRELETQVRVASLEVETECLFKDEVSML